LKLELQAANKPIIPVTKTTVRIRRFFCIIQMSLFYEFLLVGFGTVLF